MRSATVTLSEAKGPLTDEILRAHDSTEGAQDDG